MKIFPVLKTDRLTMSPYTLDDAPVVFVQRSSHEVMQYIKRAPYTDISQAVDFINMNFEQFQNDQSITWALRYEDGGELLGSICLWQFSEDRKTAEVGYDLRHELHGKGLMSEAMKAVIDYAFNVLKLNQIEAFTSFKNKSSIALLERFNFELNETRKDDGNEDNLIFELKANF
ncbi:GNAT family N-acetyltransferase [Soonwooa buanensis]|nr:GNAT family N-acetyltransferase [Soonwooa buanensis]